MFKYKKYSLYFVTLLYIMFFIIELIKYLKVDSNIYGLIYLCFNLIIIFLLVPCAYNYKKYFSTARISKLIIIVLLGIFTSYILNNIIHTIDSSKEYISKIYLYKNILKGIIYFILSIICILEFKVEKVIKSISIN